MRRVKYPVRAMQLLVFWRPLPARIALYHHAARGNEMRIDELIRYFEEPRYWLAATIEPPLRGQRLRRECYSSRAICDQLFECHLLSAVAIELTVGNYVERR